MISKWENMKRDEIKALDKTKSLILLPFASIEQHGAHLPVGTDTIILNSLIDRFIFIYEIVDSIKERV